MQVRDSAERCVVGSSAAAVPAGSHSQRPALSLDWRTSLRCRNTNDCLGRQVTPDRRGCPYCCSHNAVHCARGACLKYPVPSGRKVCEGSLLNDLAGDRFHDAVDDGGCVVARVGHENRPVVHVLLHHGQRGRYPVHNITMSYVHLLCTNSCPLKLCFSCPDQHPGDP